MLEGFIDKALAPFVQPPAPVLDYGSGPRPALTEILNRCGYRAMAWDPFFAPGAERRSWPFDAVLMHEVLEHCFDPAAALMDAASILRPGGVLALSTLFRPGNPGTFMGWWYREDATHVSFFSREGLRCLAERAGFAELACDGKSSAAFRLA
jgi:hypothetical protein